MSWQSTDNKEKKFQTIEKVKGSHFDIISNNVQQFTDNN